MGFHNAAAYAIEKLKIGSHEFKTNDITNTLKISQVLSDIVDVVWLSTFFNFDSNGKIGFRLIKISKHEKHFTLECMTSNPTPY
jgi:hypothetical protein